MKKRVYILAPNDRFNYGDLLFTHILTYFIKDKVDDIIFCSTSEKDLTSFGGVKTRDFHFLYKADTEYDDFLIVAGGECLFAAWSTILSYIYPSINNIIRFFILFRLSKFIGKRHYNNFLDSICKQKVHFQTKYPFTIGKYELPHFKGIYYNSVGGSWLNNATFMFSKSNRDILLSCDYLSVRDSDTEKAMEKLGVPHKLVPDSAILMSDIFPENLLKGKVSNSLIGWCKEEKYIFFQINYAVWGKNKEDIIGQIKELLCNNTYKLCLCPIGTALGHSDDMALAEINSILNNSKVKLMTNPTIWDIMFLILHADIYIGTSLHGAITAMSYGVPFVTHSVQKVKKYIECWIQNDKCGHFCDINDIAKFSTEMVNCRVDVSYQKRLVRDSISYIVKHINESNYPPMY